MSPEFDFWEDDAGGEDSSFDQRKCCIHQKVVCSSTPEISEFVCGHPLKNGEICDEFKCTLKEAI